MIWQLGTGSYRTKLVCQQVCHAIVKKLIIKIFFWQIKHLFLLQLMFATFTIEPVRFS